MSFFELDGLHFNYREQGSGTPFFFQHGLGGDVNQPFGVFSPPSGVRLLAFDCRGHGETRPIGDPEKIKIAGFADDLLALMTYLGIEKSIVGGISMGAAIAINFTLRFPDRVQGLVISRPAWLDGPMDKSAERYALVAQLIRRNGAQRGLQIFKQSQIYAEVLQLSPDSAKSLVGQFENPRSEETVEILERIPLDAPNHDRREWAMIAVPTLVLASHQDPIHPFEYGQKIAEFIPNSEFREVTSKSINKERHVIEVQEALEAFLKRDAFSLPVF